jgi:hypothetical protein
MTVTDFTLMSVLVILVVVLLGIIRASGVKGYFERGIFALGGVVMTIFAMTIISACFREEVKVDTLPHGNYAVQKLPNSLDKMVEVNSLLSDYYARLQEKQP